MSMQKQRLATGRLGLLTRCVSLLGLISVAAPARSEEACTAEIPPLPPYFANAEANDYPYTYFSFWREPPGFEEAIARQDYDSALQILQALSPIDRVEGWLRVVQADSFQGDRAQLLTNALALLQANPTDPNRDALLTDVAKVALDTQQADLAINALWLVTDEAAKFRQLGTVVGFLSGQSEWETAQTLKTEIYTTLTQHPDYQAVLLSEIAAQYAQAQQPELARRFFAQAQTHVAPKALKEPQEEVMQRITHHLIVAGEVEQALEMMARLQDPRQLQVDLAIALAQQGQYRNSIKQLAQISPTFTPHQLPQLIRLFLDRDQLNCAMQVAASPLLHTQDLSAVMPDLVKALIQAGRNTESLTLLQSWSQTRSSGLDTAPVVTTLVAVGATDSAATLALSFNYPSDQLTVMVALIQALAQAGDMATALKTLTTAEQIAAADLLMPPLPLPALMGEEPSPPIELSANQVSGIQQRKSIQHAITLAPAYDAVGQPQRAVAQLDAALRLTLTPDANARATGTDSAGADSAGADSGGADSGGADSGGADFSAVDETSLTHQILRQYAQLKDSTPMIESLQALRKVVSTQPDGDPKTRRLDRIAYGLAMGGAPNEALKTLPFEMLLRDTQAQIVVALAQQQQFETAQSLATQLTIPNNSWEQTYFLADWLTVWETLVAELARAEELAAAEQAFQQILLQLSTHRTQNADYVDYWVNQAPPQYAKQGLYGFAQQMAMTNRAVDAPDLQALSLPLSPQAQGLIQVAQAAIAQGEAEAGLKVVRALPIEGDRARALAGVAIALHHANQADLAQQALAEATAIARTLPNHIGKTRVLLDISQTWIDLDQLTPVPDLLTQAAAIWQ